MSIKTVLYPVTDVTAAKKTFTALVGAEPTADAPYYVGYDVDGVHVGLVPGGREQGLSGPLPHWHVDDIEATVAALVETGATVASEPRDVGNGRLVAVVTDADGNPLGLIADPS